MKLCSLFLLLIILTSCKNKSVPETKLIVKGIDQTNDSIITSQKVSTLYSSKELANFSNSDFLDLSKIDSTFFYDMKYATSDNFLKKIVYDCSNCLLRYETIKQVIKANNAFKELGFKIKFYDCYRPLSVQKKMWEIYPDKRYVANPSKGSNHNRGTAIDITLVSLEGEELDMGTNFDFFGIEAHHSYKKLSNTIIENRSLLKIIMETNGFKSISSEWWHYNLLKSYRYKVSDFETKCDNN